MAAFESYQIKFSMVSPGLTLACWIPAALSNPSQIIWWGLGSYKIIEVRKNLLSLFLLKSGIRWTSQHGYLWAVLNPNCPGVSAVDLQMHLQLHNSHLPYRLFVNLLFGLMTESRCYFTVDYSWLFHTVYILGLYGSPVQLNVCSLELSLSWFRPANNSGCFKICSWEFGPFKYRQRLSAILLCRLFSRNSKTILARVGRPH